MLINSKFLFFYFLTCSRRIAELEQPHADRADTAHSLLE